MAGAESQREKSLKYKPVFMFVSGFPSLSLPRTHNSKQLQFLHHTPPLFSLLSSPSFPLRIPPTPIQIGPNRTAPPFSFPTPCCLSIHLPTFTVPACVCAPVWLSAWSVWTLRRRKTRQVEHSWEELWGWEERAPVVQHRLLDFPSLNSETQTSEQALSGRSLCQMDILCTNTQVITQRRFSPLSLQKF